MKKENVICCRYWLNDEKYIIALNDEIGKISEKSMKLLRAADLASDWLTNSVRVYGGDNEHILVKSDPQTDLNGRAYHHRGIDDEYNFSFIDIQVCQRICCG